MAEREVPQPTEQVYLPRPSWAPAFFAIGAALMVNGIFAKGFIVPGYVYAILGAVIAVAALASMISTTARDFMRLPRRQRVRAAALPAGSLRREPKSG